MPHICTIPNCEKRARYKIPKTKEFTHCKDHKEEKMIGDKKLCEHPDCIESPFYNLTIGMPPKFCVNHKTSDMIIVVEKVCKHHECTISPSFNFPSESKPLYCKNHKTIDMIDVITRKCFETGCLKRPNYNFPGETYTKYCLTHKLEDMIDVRIKRCIYSECKKMGFYNIDGEKEPLYCFDHKLPEMVNVKSTKCLEKDCKTQPNYNLPGAGSGLYCFKHKLENMIDVNHPTCANDLCVTRPNFGLIGGKPTHCFTHKSSEMVDLTNKKCLEKGCETRPHYNYSGEKTGLYCFKHKKENMISVNTKKCANDDCEGNPAYNFPDQKQGILCRIHAKSGMIQLSVMICQNKGCRLAAIFGYLEKRAQFCLKHKKDDMINLFIKNKCSIENCDNEHEYIFDKIKYCKNHIPKSKDFLIRKRICKYCNIREESVFICSDCRTIQCKKEYSIVRHLRRVMKTEFEYNNSSMLQGCSKKRPDIFFDLPKHCIVVEIDEDQHKRYDESCECSRINEIVNSIGGRSITFIRYNPDIVKHKKEVQNFTPAERIDLLVKTLNEEIVKDHEIFNVNIIQIFYDDDYDVYTPIKREIITDKVSI